MTIIIVEYDIASSATSSASQMHDQRHHEGHVLNTNSSRRGRRRKLNVLTDNEIDLSESNAKAIHDPISSEGSASTVGIEKRKNEN